MSEQKWDTVIRNALLFDGHGGYPCEEDIAIRKGRIAARGKALPQNGAEEIDARGQWLMPGLLDIHAHLDLEVELEPGLPEVVRHGTTTVWADQAATEALGRDTLGVALRAA